jgi:hypothetical protein
MLPTSRLRALGRSHPDWRGWIAFAWAIAWGWAYCSMAFQARAPLVLSWLRAIWGYHDTTP